MHIKTQLRSWALLADVIAQQHCSHHYREKLLTGLIIQLQNYMSPRQPLWVETLNDLLQQAMITADTHTEVKCLLLIFRDTCFYLANNIGERWLIYAEETYNHRGDPEQTSPFISDPFNDWINSLDQTEDPDDKDDSDDIPL